MSDTIRVIIGFLTLDIIIIIVIFIEFSDINKRLKSQYNDIEKLEEDNRKLDLILQEFEYKHYCNKSGYWIKSLTKWDKLLEYLGIEYKEEKGFKKITK